MFLWDALSDEKNNRQKWQFVTSNIIFILFIISNKNWEALWTNELECNGDEHLVDHLGLPLKVPAFVVARLYADISRPAHKIVKIYYLEGLHAN